MTLNVHGVLTAGNTTQDMFKVQDPDVLIHKDNTRSDLNGGFNGTVDAYIMDEPELRADENGAHEMEENWETLVDFEVPDYSQVHITDVPQIQHLYDAYHTNYTDPNASNATRMKYAKALAFTLLKHYYPASQDYIIKPSSLGPIAQYGMSFILEADDNSDIWYDLPAQQSAERIKRSALTQKQKDAIKLAAAVAEYNHSLRYTLGLHWDWIGPEDIAGFVVARKVRTIDPRTKFMKDEYRVHTYLAVMIDSFEEPPRFSTANTTHRSDVLADALCRQAKLRKGYGILLYGPRIEFYDYNSGADWVHYESDDETTYTILEKAGNHEEAQDIEPVLYSMTTAGGTKDIAVDMRTSTLQAMDAAFRSVAAMSVTYVSDTIGAGNESSSGAVDE
ncbi:hypothetical protein BKA66DRAFT_439124 [Pyrenochaeta sp. MPI-SDFR-AT-0127]|nr:hypothetical protein BKA66DRAFT_439124 [Pyrenochaeta sp. MPI-SDFR-AT-0127]